MNRHGRRRGPARRRANRILIMTVGSFLLTVYVAAHWREWFG